MRFAEGSDLRFALSAIRRVKHGTSPVRIPRNALLSNSLAIRLASIFTAAGQKMFGFKAVRFLRN